MKTLIEKIFEISDDIRYVAIYRAGKIDSKSKEGTSGASNSESDKYEELLVNPTLLLLAKQRGDIDCGGLNHILISYGNFYQFVFSKPWGHVSVCIEPLAEPISIGLEAMKVVSEHDSP
jgi:hypothetical protein